MDRNKVAVLAASVMACVNAAPALAQTSGEINLRDTPFRWSNAPWRNLTGAGTYPTAGGRATFLELQGTLTSRAFGATYGIDLNVPVTLSLLEFRGANLVWISGTSALTLPAGGGTIYANSPARTLTPLVTNLSQQISVPIAGGPLTKTGTGTLLLSSANTYAGGTTIRGGTLAISTGDTGLGAAGSANSLTIDGGTLSVRTANLLAGTRSLAAGANGATIETFSGMSIGGNVSGSGTLTHTAASSTPLQFEANNSFSGRYVQHAGTTWLVNAGALNNVSRYDLTGYLNFSGAAAGANRLSDTAPINSSGAVINLNNNTGTFTELAGKLSLASSTTTIITPSPNGSNPATCRISFSELERLNRSTLSIQDVASTTSTNIIPANVSVRSAAGITPVGGVIPWIVGSANSFGTAALQYGFQTLVGTNLQPATGTTSSFGAATANVVLPASTSVGNVTANSVVLGGSARR